MANNFYNFCQIPKDPPFGQYNTLTVSYSRVAQPNSILILTCKFEHNFNFPLTTEFRCSKNGQWIPTLRGCIDSDIPSISHLPIKNLFNISYINVILTVAVAICFVGALIAVILFQLKFKKERELKKELKLAGLDHFQNGDLERYNPELGIDDQADLLPYNNNYEFPRNMLKLGKLLGCGEFGIVNKAIAFGIMSNEEKTTVAVKTVKNIANHIHIKALISELKIMVHLGQHLNVVNLLGACTKNINRGELLVIVEYCAFGNLNHHLLSNRKNYINQIIDYDSMNLPNVSTASTSISTSREIDLQNSSSFIGAGNSTFIRSSNDNIPSENFKPLYTKDLISWSFQVARGMAYLASRKILHGDLAARNILLAENNIVKICDFGLAKRTYKSVNYKKQTNSPLPIKWMAIESIRDRIFSTQSDVWSYGIVLWEIFSLAETPYPDMDADERLYYKLIEGYKMESPPYAPKAIYKIMRDCWNVNPEARPSFNELAELVGLMLENNVRQHIVELNADMNNQRLNEGQTEYLEILGSSNLQQITISHNYI